MDGLNLSGITPYIAKNIAPFFEEVIKGDHNIHSIYIVGSVLTPDFDEKTSDINSVILLKDIDLGFLRLISSLGKRYIKYRVSAPLLMTPLYIKRSLDTFPLEFLDLRLIHKCVYGEDTFNNIEIDKKYLRLQCEREIKARLIGLRQGYISSIGNRDILLNLLSRSITGCIPLFRAIIFLMGKEPAIKRTEVLRLLHDSTGIETDMLEKVLLIKGRVIRPSEDEIHSIFEQYYRRVESIEQIIDELIV